MWSFLIRFFLVGDEVPSGSHEGCEELRKVVKKIQPQYHVFGHIHEGYGVTREPHVDTTFINASTCTLRYKPVNKPILFRIKRSVSGTADTADAQAETAIVNSDPAEHPKLREESDTHETTPSLEAATRSE